MASCLPNLLSTWSVSNMACCQPDPLSTWKAVNLTSCQPDQLSTRHDLSYFHPCWRIYFKPNGFIKPNFKLIDILSVTQAIFSQKCLKTDCSTEKCRREWTRNPGVNVWNLFLCHRRLNCMLECLFPACLFQESLIFSRWKVLHCGRLQLYFKMLEYPKIVPWTHTLVYFFFTRDDEKPLHNIDARIKNQVSML